MISIAIMLVVASFVGSELGQVLFSGQHQCRRMPCILTQTLQIVFRERVKAHTNQIRGLLEAEIEKVQNQLNKYTKGKSKSIWDMKKAELVEEAQKVLGWDYATAEKQTCNQLRMFLRQAAKENHSKKLLPTGLNRLVKKELQECCIERGVSIQKDGKTLDARS